MEKCRKAADKGEDDAAL